jgi:ribonuclease P/MRP protein subunit RPP40
MDRECLENVQKRAVGMVSGLKERRYEERLRELRLTTLAERRHRADMQMVHKLMMNENGLDHNTWFERAADSGRATRLTADPLNIKPKSGRLEIRRNFFTIRVIEEWNRIPANIKARKTPSSFKAAYSNLRDETAYPAAETGRRER